MGTEKGTEISSNEDGNNGHSTVKDEGDILDLIKQENSWEQILYDVVALEDLDPWNLDLNALSSGFAEYISTIKELDFRIPAKWVIIAAILLRMKSDAIKIMKTDRDAEDEEFMDLDEFEDKEGLEDPAASPSRRWTCIRKGCACRR